MIDDDEDKVKKLNALAILACGRLGERFEAYDPMLSVDVVSLVSQRLLLLYLGNSIAIKINAAKNEKFTDANFLTAEEALDFVNKSSSASTKEAIEITLSNLAEHNMGKRDLLGSLRKVQLLSLGSNRQEIISAIELYQPECDQTDAARFADDIIRSAEGLLLQVFGISRVAESPDLPSRPM